MRKEVAVILLFILSLADTRTVAEDSGNIAKTDVVTMAVEQQHEFVRPEDRSALAVHFQLKEDWHFYASAKTAPAGMNLKLKPSAEEDYISFSDPIFPHSRSYFDKSLGQNLDVFSGKFTVFLPFRVAPVLFESNEPVDIAVEVGIEGAVCSDIQCRVPDFGKLSTTVRILPFSKAAAKPGFVLPDSAAGRPERGPAVTSQGASYSVWFALGLAFLAGLSLNIMPCVWPVLPIIVMRIVEQAKQSRGKSIAMGLAFCFGILLFFACLAATSAILRLFYGTVLQWGDQFRNPAFVAGMALLLVALALFMFGLFTVTVPSSIAGKSGSGKGLTGAVGMGFLAAILSTPCSFGILAAAFAWAQGQHLALGTLAIMYIGVGMAVPYAVLTSVPGLLNRLPRAGRWMELFKQAIGFVLLVIAVKLIAAVPEARRTGVLYFAVVLGFCIWMWGGWVSYNTKALRKWLIRVIAAALAVAAGWTFLPAPPDGPIDWQKYDPVLIEKHLAQRKPVLIKFTADWCLSCQVVEKTVYSREDIAKLIEDKNVLPIKADTTTKDYPATLALKDKYREPGVPVTVIHTPDGTELHLRGLIGKNDLKKVLNNLPDAED